MKNTDGKSDTSLATAALLGLLWSLVQNWGARIMTLTIFVVLARLLAPADFGLVAMAMLVISFCEMVLEQGVGDAIVQRKELESDHLDSAFWALCGIGGAIAIAIVVLAPSLSNLIGNAALVPVVIALAPCALLVSINGVPNARLRRALDYKTLAIRSTLANFVAGTAGVGLAFAGYGVWSLVAQQWVFYVVATFILWSRGKWRPSLKFSCHRAVELLKFCGFSIANKLLDFSTTRIVDLLIGTFLGTTALGYFALGSRLVQVLQQILSSAFTDVAFSVFSRMQTDLDALRLRYRQALSVMAAVTLPLFAGLASLASILVPLGFGSQWIASVPVLIFLAVLGGLQSIQFINGGVLYALGKPHWAMLVNLAKLIAIVISFFLTFRAGVDAIAVGLLVAALLVSPISFGLTFRLLHARAGWILSQLWPQTASAIVMSSVLLWILPITEDISAILRLAILSAIGFFLYLVLLMLLAPGLMRSFKIMLTQILGGGRIMSRIITLRGYLGRFKRWLALQRLLLIGDLLRLIQKSNSETEGRGLKVLVLTPAEPFGGSLGDEAMLRAVLNQLRQFGATQICLVAAASKQPKDLESGLQAVSLWQGWLSPWRFAREVRKFDYFYCMGADVMDGYYSPLESCQRILYLDLAARSGVKAVALGFSFNSSPDPRVIRLLRQLPSSVRLNARDPISAERLKSVLNRSVEVVADLAFMLDPSQLNFGLRGINDFLVHQHDRGRTVIGINVHKLLVHRQDPEAQSRLISAVATAMERLSNDFPTAFVLIAHDFRGDDNDGALLKRIHDDLPTQLQECTLLIDGVMTAGEIKTLCAELDLVVTGRMHLAIAALGQGVPIAGISYQAKFEGLLMHFGMDETLLLTPDQAQDPMVLSNFIAAMVKRHLDLRLQVREHLPRVKRLSQLNFAGGPFITP